MTTQHSTSDTTCSDTSTTTTTTNTTVNTVKITSAATSPNTNTTTNTPNTPNIINKDRTVLPSHSAIERVAGTLIKSDINLLALALSAAHREDAIDIINDVKMATGIDLLDRKLTTVLEDSQAVDALQNYETMVRSHLTELLQKYHEEIAAREQKAVLRVRYSKFRMWYGASITTFACAYMLYITFRDLSYADTVLGFLMGTLVGTVVTFYFGSSAKLSDLSENEVASDKHTSTTTSPIKK